MKKIRLKQEDYENMTIDQLEYFLIVQGKNKIRVHDKIRQLNRQWNEDLTCQNCQVCNYSKHVELAHLNSISNFNKHTLIKEVNDKDNILVLCRNCHWEFDSGILNLEDIPIRK